MKTQVVIDSCIMAGLNATDKRFLREYEELRCNDITANGCHITIYREHHTWADNDFYPSAHAGFYLSEDDLPKKHRADPKAFIDNLNEMMNDFFERNGIEGDTFLYYISW